MVPMNRQTVEQITTRIEHVAAQAKHPIIATDADGTLWGGDLAVDGFWTMVTGGFVTPMALDALRARLGRAGFPRAENMTIAARQLYEAFVRNAISDATACELMGWCYAGLTEQRANELGHKVLVDGGLTHRLQPEMGQVVRWAKKAGIEVYVVSASPRFVVQLAAEQVGIEPQNVIAANLAIVDGVLQPRLDEPLCYGKGKVSAIARHLPDAQVIAAFGDELYDLEMLRIAQIPVAVRPKPRLIRAAGPSVVELEGPPPSSGPRFRGFGF